MTETSLTRRLSRRRLLQLLGGLTAAAAFAVSYTRLIEPRWVDLEEVTLRLVGLPDRLAGKRLVQLSDLHLCEYFAPQRLLEVAPLINRLQPDWVMLTGDYVGDDASSAAGLVEPLRRIEAPIYAVFGNHDYWSDIHVVSAKLAEARVHTLRNESTALAEGLWLAGVDDVWSGRPDLKATLRDLPEGVTTLLLAHEPDFFDRVVQQKAPVAAQLSGHSHGGQVRIPTLRPGGDGLYTYAPILPRYGRRYPIGLRQVGSQQIYTSRGLGVWPIPYRLNCRPEITLFTLEPAL
ncbi:MAG TPA: metallophosphoesterase [Caldilineaceae bacterium]|nr:metallophosphoesterase [Caldilineaceae bacterium]